MTTIIDVLKEKLFKSSSNFNDIFKEFVFEVNRMEEQLRLAKLEIGNLKETIIKHNQSVAEVELSLALGTIESRERNIEYLMEENTELRHKIVMEFSEDEIPEFVQGYSSNEILEIVTAERCNNLIDIIVSQREQLNVLRNKLAE